MALTAPRQKRRISAKAFLSCLAIIACGHWLIWTQPLYAASDPARVAAICEAAAEQAATRYGMPVAILQALTLTESGRKLDGRLRPWPWTLNVSGRGYWFKSRQEALDFVRHEIPKDVRSYDIGCFQINRRWHGHAFASEADMFDPNLNADYAARFLMSLLPEFKSWEKAAGAYHSRTPKFAQKYEQKFAAHLARLDAHDLPILPAPDAAPILAKTPRTLLGQPVDWEQHLRTPGSLSRLHANPKSSGLLRQTGRSLF